VVVNVDYVFFIGLRDMSLFDSKVPEKQHDSAGIAKETGKNEKNASKRKDEFLLHENCLERELPLQE